MSRRDTPTPTMPWTPSEYHALVEVLGHPPTWKPQHSHRESQGLLANGQRRDSGGQCGALPSSQGRHHD